MSLGDYTLGCLGLIACVAPAAYAASGLRRRLLGGWEGTSALLVDAIATVALLTFAMQLVGVAGLFSPLPLLLASWLVSGLVLVLAKRLPRSEDASAGGAGNREGAGLQVALGLVGVAFLFAHWATGLQDVWDRGMLSADTIWYHGPFAARIAEQGSVWPLHFTDPAYLNWFYPQNSELQHALGIAFTGHDVLSPFVNLAWLALALLGAWCLGRPFGAAGLCVLAVSVLLDTGTMVPRQAGTMANDVAPVALLLAVAGLLVTAATRRPADSSARKVTIEPAVLGLVGLAAGLAIGTKLTSGAIFFALGIGLVVIAPKGSRALAAGALAGGTALTGGLWFVRNLVQSGNPIPWLQSLGPIDLPGPGRGLEGRDPYSLSHYVFAEPGSQAWSEFILPGLDVVLGPLWPAMLLAALAGAVLAAWRPRAGSVGRVLGIAALVGWVAYLFTPLTAAGPEGQPLAFTINLRYAFPALCLGIALLPLEQRLSGHRARLAMALAGLFALVVTTLYSDSAFTWSEPGTSLALSIAIGILAAALVLGVAAAYSRSGRLAPYALAGLLAVVFVASWPAQDDYLRNRYAHGGFGFQSNAAARWAKPTSDQSVGLVGTGGAYSQYPLYGDRLSNRVQYLGRRGPGGDFRELRGCRALLRAVGEGRYDYVVTTPNLDLNRPATLLPDPAAAWLSRGPATREVAADERGTVFELVGRVDPNSCRDPLSGKREAG